MRCARVRRPKVCRGAQPAPSTHVRLQVEAGARPHGLRAHVHARPLRLDDRVQAAHAKRPAAVAGRHAAGSLGVTGPPAAKRRAAPHGTAPFRRFPALRRRVWTMRRGFPTVGVAGRAAAGGSVLLAATGRRHDSLAPQRIPPPGRRRTGRRTLPMLQTALHLGVLVEGAAAGPRRRGGSQNGRPGPAPPGERPARAAQRPLCRRSARLRPRRRRRRRRVANGSQNGGLEGMLVKHRVSAARVDPRPRHRAPLAGWERRDRGGWRRLARRLHKR